MILEYVDPTLLSYWCG